MFWQNKHQKKAENLVVLANTVALSSTSLYTQFPVLENMVEDDRLLVFLMTVAGVGVGVTLIDESVSENEIMKFSYAIADKLKDWDLQGYQPFGSGGAYTAYVDLANFIRGKEAEEYFAGVGFWLVSNLKGSHPERDELVAGVAISNLLGTSLFGWWNRV